MNQFKNYFRPAVLLCAFVSIGALQVTAQSERPRLVRSSSSRPVNAPTPATVQPSKTVSNNPVSSTTQNRPALLNKIVLAQPTDRSLEKPGIKANLAKEMTKQTSAPLPANLLAFNSKIMSGIESRLGIRYVYGSQGPNSYDCSGFVWSVFQEAGIVFERSSAANYWNKFEPAEGNERFKFGTLIFLNGLGHMGIVADENGFYHASRSKGITYSPFAGYWGKRITGYRKVPVGFNGNTAFLLK